MQVATRAAPRGRASSCGCPHGVDLAVVRDVAVRVGQRPRRERVRREPGVHQGERAGRPARRRGPGRTPRAAGRSACPCRRSCAATGREVGAGLVLGALAQAERAPSSAIPVERRPRRRRPGDEQLAEAAASPRGRSGRGRLVDVGRDVAPAEHAQALLGGELLDPRDGVCGPLRVVVGQERDADGVGAGGRQREVDDLAQERVRDLDQDAGAVAGVGLGAAGAAVLEVAAARSAPLRTIAWSRRPARSATKATPQASCSFSAEYIPAVAAVTSAAGRPVARSRNIRRSQEFLLSSRCTPTPASGRRVVRAKCRMHPMYRSTRPIGGPGMPDASERASYCRTAVGQSGDALVGASVGLGTGPTARSAASGFRAHQRRMRCAR